MLQIPYFVMQNFPKRNVKIRSANSNMNCTILDITGEQECLKIFVLMVLNAQSIIEKLNVQLKQIKKSVIESQLLKERSLNVSTNTNRKNPQKI
jgi:hypothetical protein